VRRAALEVLNDADRSGEFIDEVLARRMREFEPRDRHLLQEIAYGTVRHRGTLDHLLGPHLKAPQSKQKPPLRWALRLGAYQLVYLGRIPAHAAVNQTLEGLKGIEGVTAKDVGFVNAVLHKVASEIRKKTADPPIDRDDPTVLPIRKGFCHFSRPLLPLYRLDAIQHIAVKHSYPAWLIARWVGRFGEEEARLLAEAQNRTPPLAARVTTLAPSREAAIAGLEAEGMAAVPGNLETSVFIQNARDLERSETFAKGWLQVEDETAIQIGDVLAPPAGARVLDLCAAPGGKALQLLEAAGPSGHLTAADRSEEKLALVRENLSRLGSNFRTVALPPDPAAVDLGEKFTHVLVDAPCSNTGVLGRRPEARWRVRRDDLAALAKLQGEILDAGLRHLAPGGRLVYATCSIEPEENEEVVARAFARHGGLVERETRLFLPHRTPGDGGFFSLLLRPRA
jgi:16S rRNA (cytosine967-C5)-methyltransferase